MKKVLQVSKWLLSFVLIFCCVLSVERGTVSAVGSTSSSGKASVFVAVNDKLLNFDGAEAIIHNGTLYVPVVQTSKVMNASVQYTKGQITVTQNGKTLTQKVPSQGALLKNGKTLISYRLLSDKFGYQLSYLSSVSVYRATNGSAGLTNSQFVDKYGTYIKEHKKPAAVPPPAGTPQGKRVIYITFDDGPNAGTPALLNVLDQNKVKATFFMLGNNIASHPDAVRRIVKEGHGLGLHGMTHQKNKFYASPAAALQEMNADNDKLHSAARVYTKLIRPPYGSKPYFTKKFRDLTAASGYHLWDWNVDSNDWRYTKNPQTIYNNVLRDVKAMKKKGVTPVVLFHDQQATTSILSKLIKSLQAEGYTFEPLTNEKTPLNFWNDHR